MKEPRATVTNIPVWCPFDELMSVETLKQLRHPQNPNTHPRRQIEILAGVIEQHGFRNSITTSSLSGRIIYGHGRLEAAILLGLDSVPVAVQEFASEEDELAALVADNQLSELSSFDLNLLEEIRDQWKDEDFNTLLAGFDDGELDALLADPQEPEDDEDSAEPGDPVEPAEVNIRIGRFHFSVSSAQFERWVEDIRETDIDPCCLCVCFLVLMFLPVRDRRELLARIVESLEPGGAIIVVDKAEPPARYPGVISSRLTMAAKLDQGASPEEVLRKELSLAGVQRPLSPDDLPPGAVEFFRFGDFFASLIEKPISSSGSSRA